MLTTPAIHKRLVASMANPIQTAIFLPLARISSACTWWASTFPCSTIAWCNGTAMLSCSLLPSCYCALIQSICLNNGLLWTSIAQSYHHGHHQFHRRAQSFHHGSSEIDNLCTLVDCTVHEQALALNTVAPSLSDYSPPPDEESSETLSNLRSLATRAPSSGSTRDQ
jgi:hypothetical protein